MYSFVSNRKYAYAVAVALFLFSLLSPFILPFRQGIDLTGGIQAEYSVPQWNVDGVIASVKSNILPAAKNALSDTEKPIITDTLAYKISGSNTMVVEAWIDESSAKKQNSWDALKNIESAKTHFLSNIQQELSKTYPNAGITQGKYVNIGASFGEYIKQSGYFTIALAVIAISIYIMYAFSGSIPGMKSWPFAVVTAVSLLHDVVISFGLYVLASAIFPEFKIDTFFITALLTVLGYSINDSIVIMDRIRSNLKEHKNIALAQVIDTSIHETMRRSLFTSLTVVIVLLAMFFFGPHAISGFTLALIFGTIVGTASSIFIAAPLLVDITKRYNVSLDPKNKK